jgi:hypothetical protein
VRDAEVVQPVLPDAVVALGKVQDERRGGPLDLVGEVAVVGGDQLHQR